MDETTETSTLTMGQKEALATARRLCRGYLEHRGMRVVDDGGAGDAIVARDGDEAVLVRVTASVGGGERSLPVLDVNEGGCRRHEGRLPALPAQPRARRRSAP